MSQQPTRLYEGMYILRASLSDDAREKTLAKIQEEIKEYGGEVVKLHDRGRQRLAYEIDSQREGYYYVMYFNALPSAILTMQHSYHLMEDLLRFMTLQATEVLENFDFKPVGNEQ